MTQKVYTLQEERRRARWSNPRWVNLHFFDDLEDAKNMAKFYEERTGITVRIKETKTNKVIYQTGF